jgi:hypothetical protein
MMLEREEKTRNEPRLVRHVAASHHSPHGALITRLTDILSRWRAHLVAACRPASCGGHNDDGPCLSGAHRNHAHDVSTDSQLACRSVMSTVFLLNRPSLLLI